eukprot:TRINITY_DN3801_c0_g1_i1.p1 TRINITY_DN3801_c0_g1~~TRINITY_DN3801_c0_g1_i1.p1  ORF type:complete len:251 (-),score=37.61 TRINITY_DN3801_c0_g1_i1:84-836(-)
MAAPAFSSGSASTSSDRNLLQRADNNFSDINGQMIPAWVLTVENPDGGRIYALQAIPLSMMPLNFSGGLVPLTYNIPSRPNAQGTAELAAATSQNYGADQRPERPRDFSNQEGRRGEVQRQRLLRLLTGFQIGLLLALKVAVIFFLLNRAGSRDRLRLMMFLNFANLVYLYRIGAFDSILKWLSNGARRAMIPSSQTPRPREDQQDGVQEGSMNERGHYFHWHGLIKEVQMIVVGFVASLFPGFRFTERE